MKNAPHIQILAKALLFLINFLFVFHTQIISNTEFSGSVLDIILYSTYIPLVLINIFCIILILQLPKSLQRALFTLNVLFSSFVYVHFDSLSSPPTLTSIFNSFHLIDGMELTPYIPTWLYILAFISIILIQYLISLSSQPTTRYKYIIVTLGILLISHLYIYNEKPVFKGVQENVQNSIRQSINVRGLLSTYFIEYINELHKIGAIFSKEMHPPTQNINELPKLPVRANVVFIQVESLDYDMVNKEVNSIPIMPFLSNLQKNSTILKVDGSKLLGSSNSDYETLTTRKASKDFLAYEFVTDFSDNIAEKLAKQGFKTRTFHNVIASYMNLDHAYKLMGFQERNFAEELKAAGYKPLKNIWNERVLSDANLFEFVTKNPPSDEGRFFDFIITFTMHSPEYVQDTTPFEQSEFPNFFKACNDTDTAISKYYNSLKDGTFVVIYSDHTSYFMGNNKLIPYIFHVKGENHHFIDNNTVYTRTDMSHYLRLLLNAK